MRFEFQKAGEGLSQSQPLDIASKEAVLGSTTNEGALLEALENCSLEDSDMGTRVDLNSAMVDESSFTSRVGANDSSNADASSAPRLEQQSVLLQAIFEREWSQVEDIIKNSSYSASGMSEIVQTQDAHRRTPLHAAAYVGDTTIVSTLIDSGARINHRDYNGMTALHLACQKNNAHCVQLLLQNRAESNTRDKIWHSPLHIASAHNSLESAESLVSHVANINIADRNGQTALHLAACHGHFQIVELLLNHGANVQAMDRADRRPIHLAASKSHCEIARLLLEKGADVHCRDKSQRSCLHAAANGGNAQIAQLLIDAGAEIDSMDCNQDTPLHIACLNGHSDFVKKLIDNNAKIHIPNNQHITPLHCAATARDPSRDIDSGPDACLKYIIEHHADSEPGKTSMVNAVDKYNRTALSFACAQESKSRVKMLLEYGTDLLTCDYRGDSCLHIAAIHGHIEILNLLVRHLKKQFSEEQMYDFINLRGQNGMTALHIAGIHGHSVFLRYLLRNKADVMIHDSRGRTIYHAVSYSGSTECMSIISSAVQAAGKGARQKDDSFDEKNNDSASSSDSEDWERDYQGELAEATLLNQVDERKISASHVAAWSAESATLEWLLNKSGGAKKSGLSNGPPDARGRTPLHFAMLKDVGGKCVEALIKHHAETLATDADNFNPLHWAARSGHEQNIKLIVDSSQTVLYSPEGTGITSSKRFTPLHLAARYGHNQALEQLEQLVVDPDSMDENRCTPLWYACKYGHAITVTTLIAAGASPFPIMYGRDGADSDIDPTDTNEPTMLGNPSVSLIHDDDDGEGTADQSLSAMARPADMPSTPLHEAARHGHTKILEEVLEVVLHDIRQKEAKISGASLDCKERVNGGETPLMLAVLHNHHDCVKTLVEKGAKVTAKDNFGRTALHRVVIPADQQIMMELFQISNGEPDVAIRDENGMTPFHVAALDTETGQYILNVMVHVADISNGCHLMPDNRGFSPLHYAAFRGNIEFITNFLTSELSYAANTDGWNEHQAALDRILGIPVKKGSGADEAAHHVSSTFEFNKFTPLHCAAYSDQHQVVEELLKAYTRHEDTDEDEGILRDIKVLDRFGRTPLHIACMASEACRDTTETLISCQHQALSRHDVKDVNGWTAAMVAAKFNNTDCLDMILEQNASTFNWRILDRYHNSVLAIACLSGAEDYAIYCVNQLQPGHALIRLANDDGDTPLHLAAKTGMWRVVEALLEKGANDTLTHRNNTENATPLDLCIPDPHVRQCAALMLGATFKKIETSFASTTVVAASPKSKKSSKKHSSPPEGMNANRKVGAVLEEMAKVISLVENTDYIM